MTSPSGAAIRSDLVDALLIETALVLLSASVRAAAEVTQRVIMARLITPAINLGDEGT